MGTTRETWRIDRIICCQFYSVFSSIQFSKTVFNSAWAVGSFRLQLPDFGVSGDFGNLAGPTPSLVIPSWRRVGRVHPKSSQIGVDFSDLALIGVGFSDPILFLIRGHPC
jgi:hypothetical protein